ncbi:hypothetical protein [Paraburkholderia sp. GAS348]|uniref:hypothetical protein n=1 Tax=Paraburkholderia sp. GAS348 TaxID=3035132 RepID=UPI003D1ECEBD
MPVDLSPAGLPRAYPTNKPRLVPWLIGWVLCWAIGAAVALLLWPVSTPARGAWFLFCVVGLPNGLFFLVLGISRAGYEALWFRAHYWNMHRCKWLNSRVRYAQQPLQILGVGYCLPLDDKGLSEALAATTTLMKAQAPRNGLGKIVHSRFADADSLCAEPADTAPLSVDKEAMTDATGQDPIETPVLTREAVPPIVRMLAQTLDTLAPSLNTLSQYGAIYAPAVRVLASAESADIRVHQVRHALQIADLPAFECMPIPASDGLLVADAWLDAAEKRPLLVIAAEWHDALPSVGSTEGAIAVLLGPGIFVLPEPVKVMATLHRPVAGELDTLTDLLANAVLWGNAEAPTVNPAWISGLEDSHETALLAALGKAKLTGVTKLETQRRPDGLIGHAGAAGGWLSIAAAVESATAGPHLILHSPKHTQTAQAAILYVNPATNSASPHDESNE